MIAETKSLGAVQSARSTPPNLALLAAAGVTGDDADSIFAMPRAFLQRRSTMPLRRMLLK
jgi:hypothetical protein